MITNIPSGSNLINISSTSQAKGIEESISQRLIKLLNAANIECGPMALELDENESIAISGELEGKQDILDAIQDDKQLKNLLKMYQNTSPEDSLLLSDGGGGGGTVAGLSIEQLSSLWAEMDGLPDKKEKFTEVFEKLQMFEAIGKDYTGEISSKAILEADVERDYYQHYAQQLSASMPSMLDYMSSGSSQPSSMLDYLGGGNASPEFSGSYSTLDASVMKAYQNQGGGKESLMNNMFNINV